MKFDLDNLGKLTPMMAQYVDIKRQHKDYLLFYRTGDFYELFLDDAIIASEALDITLTKRGKIGDIDIPMCGVPFHAYESYLSRLIKQGYKVAICEQTEDPKEAKKRGAKSVVERKVIRLVTAGTLTEEPLLEAKKNNFLLSISNNSKSLGIAWIDISTGEFFTQELEYTAKNEIDILSSLLARLSPVEILVSDKYFYSAGIFELLKSFDAQITPLPEIKFDITTSNQRLKSLFKIETLDSYGSFSKSEISAGGVLVDYINISQKEQMPLILPPKKIIDCEVMQLDASTRKSLELTSSISGDKSSCLLKSIDKTVTASGGRLLSSYLSNPLLNVQKINARLDIIEFFINHPDLCSDIREILRSTYDIGRSLSRICAFRGGPKDMDHIKNTLYLIPNIKNKINFCNQNKDNILIEFPQALQQVLSALGDNSELVLKLSQALKDESDLPVLNRDGGFIREGYSAPLDELKDIEKHGKNFIANLQNKYCEQTQIPNLKIKYNNLIGYYIEVPSKNAVQLLENPDFIFRQSVLNASRFSTVELGQLEEKIKSASEKALAIELAIYQELVDKIKLSAPDIIKTCNALSKLDVASSLAVLAMENNYCRPEINDSLAFIVKGGRHPVVEQSLKRNSEASFVGNDCIMEQNKSNLWLLTGPNMAGKSTYLRQNAIIAIMAQIGSYVPCDYAQIGVINKIFSRVGASDDLAKGQSTFMVEMVETATILNQADERSFVILDEIGRGTATFDGLSIAWAVVEYLHEINRCRCLFATHYHELTSLSGKLSRLSLHKMKIKEFNGEVVFLHEVTQGAADQSYGIHVAKLAGLPKAVLKRADNVLKNIEKENKGLSAKDISEELPLFTHYCSQQEEKVSSPALDELKSLNPDDLSPREALEKLYELKKLL